MNQSEERRDELYERLCAYVLGELEGAERASLEAELERSPELRAERERIERTIGLVQGALGDDAGAGETLSPATTDHLMQKAARPAPILRFPRRWTGLAAAAGFLGLTFLAWRAVETGPGVRGVDGFVAKAPQAEQPAPVAANEPLRDEADADAVVSLGREAGKRSELALASGEREKKARALMAKAQDDAPQGLRSSTAGREFADGNGADRETVQALSWLGSDSTRGGGAALPPVDQEALDALGGLGYLQDGKVGSQARTVPRATGPGIRDLGYADEALEEAAIPPRTFRGPGDTVPPSGSGSGKVGPATPAAESAPERLYAARFNEMPSEQRAGGTKESAGLEDMASRGLGSTRPASPGPSTKAGAAGSSSLRAGEQDLFLGEGERVDALRSLGYVDDDQDGGDAYSDKLESRYRFEYHRQYEAGLGVVDADELCRRVLERCRRRPDERPRDMFFRFWGDNAFVFAHQDPLATLSADVDTASYALARNYLRSGNLPPEAAVRTEEFLNYFKPDVPAPSESTFAIHTELAPSRFGPTADHWMLRVVVRGKEVSKEERKPLALTIVLDVSGSMKEHDRMELVKYGVRMLLGELDARDSVAIVTFNNEARILLPMISAADRGAIETALHGIRPDGGTNAESGLKLGYELSSARLTQDAHNRVVLFSDGVANIGQTDQNRIGDDVAVRREEGIYLNTIGVGMGNHNDVFLEQLADRGDGLCNYVDTPLEAQRALVDNFLGAFEPIARDVKLQVQFDPTQVLRYRQLGYENRRVADADFRNDAVDAGEVGAGHQVVALFELERAGGADAEAALATVRLRWKPPHGAGGAAPETEVATEIEHAVRAREAQGSAAAAGPGFLRATLVAQFAEVLRGSVHASGDSYDALLSETQALARTLGDPDFTELVELQKQARDLLAERRARGHGDLRRCVDAVRRNAYLRAELEELERGREREELEQLERENRELEQRLSELLRGAIQERGADQALRELGEF